MDVAQTFTTHRQVKHTKNYRMAQESGS